MTTSANLSNIAHWPGRPPRLRHVYNSAPLYFVTCCTANHCPILACTEVHEAFCAGAIRIGQAGNAVGRYVIMPDHFHVFIRIGRDGKLGQAVKCLREGMTKRLHEREVGLKVWQAGYFDHVMRSSDSYGEKWAYVRENPVRAGLVRNAADWPYQGEVEVIRW